MRVFLTIFIPLFLPSAVYWVYLRYRERRGLPIEEVPWTWLIVSGVGLVVVALMVTWYADAEPTEGRYIPPQVVDGEVVPGHFVPRTDDTAQ